MKKERKKRKKKFYVCRQNLGESDIRESINSKKVYNSTWQLTKQWNDNGKCKLRNVAIQRPEFNFD